MNMSKLFTPLNKEIKTYNPEIDLLKLFFSVAVLLFHTYKIPGLKSVMPRGFLAVEFFFLVTGYFMGIKLRSGNSPDTDKFILRKLAPIYPIILAATLIAFVERMIPVGGDSLLQWLISIPQSFFEVSLLWMQGISVGRSYNGPTWYISAMVIAMAIIYPLFRKHWKYFSFVGSLLLSIVCYSIIFNQHKTLCVASQYYGITTFAVIRAIAGLSLGVFLNECCNRANAVCRITTAGNILFAFIKLFVFAFIVAYMFNLGNIFKINVLKFDYVIVAFIFFFLFLVFSKWGSFSFLDKFNLGWCSQLGLYLYLNHRGMTHFLNASKLKLSGTEKLVVFLGGTLLSMILCFVLVRYGGKLLRKIRNCFFEMIRAS